MTLAFTGVSHWLEPSVAWLRGSKQIPTALCSTPLYETPWAIAVPVLVHKHCSTGRIASCCVFTLGDDMDETTLSWKSFLLVAHKAFSLVTSAIVRASHSKHVEPRSEMLSQPSGCCWMSLWTWDFPLNWFCWSWTIETRTRAGVYGSYHVHYLALLVLTTSSADSYLTMLPGRGLLGTAKLMWLTWKSHSKLSLPPGSEEKSRNQSSQMPTFPWQCIYLMCCASG